MSRNIRSTEEIIVLALSGLTVLSLIPLSVIRFIQAEWEIAVLDTTAVVLVGGIFLHVYKTGKTELAGKMLATICYLVLLTTIKLGGASQLLWAYPALTAVFFLIPPRFALALSSICLLIMGGLIWTEISLLEKLKFYISTFSTLLFSYAFAEKMLQQKSQLLELVSKDPLTGTGNRRAMEEKLREIYSHKQRKADVPASVILMDLDDFKKLNDKFGHSIGDLVLVEFVQTLNKQIRATDSLYRIGGEEFLIVAETCNKNAALEFIDQLHLAIATSATLRLYGLSMSVGIAEYKDAETTSDWFGRADTAMYEAKRQGHNSTCSA
ncbi:GGDEF domain-containing protein [Teredinibacter franksiae]|uniref:GGDEF domain-containing protein n=1 Tax=Teredinibacter franksiae TaxID=2761453 RepID=UPI0016276225|nr:GGDEF domain-containing protein [Teredinibacter franksiae]